MACTCLLKAVKSKSMVGRGGQVLHTASTDFMAHGEQHWEAGETSISKTSS